MINAFEFGFPGYELVGPPAEGFWRVSGHDEPLSPPPPARPLDADSRDDDGHRFDDPAGEFLTLYCASEAEGALGECLGDFAFNAAVVRRIEAFLQSEPDEEHDEDYHHPLTAGEVEAFGWYLAQVPGDPAGKMINVDSWRTYCAAAPRAVPALVRQGIRRFDRHTLLDPRRVVTRTLAGIYRDDATDRATGDLLARGLKFTSRLPPAWECWALWEPLPIMSDRAVIEPVRIDLPALRKAAAMLGIMLAD